MNKHSSDETEILNLFIEDALEHLSTMEQDLLNIEKGGANIDAERVNNVFRAAHSIKGSAGFAGLQNIKALAHAMENVLGLIRKQELIPNPEIVNFLLQAMDGLKQLIADVEQSEAKDVSEYVEALQALVGDVSGEETQNRSTRQQEAFQTVGAEIQDEAGFKADETQLALEQGQCLYRIHVDPRAEGRFKGQSRTEILEELAGFGTVLEEEDSEEAGADRGEPLTLVYACVLETQDLANLLELDPAAITELDGAGNRRKPDHEAFGSTDPDPDIAHSPVQQAVNQETGEEDHSHHRPAAVEQEGAGTAEAVLSREMAGSSLRVRTSLLDSLMNLAGELVLGRNQLLQAVATQQPKRMQKVSQRISSITSELQEAVMLTRMQPMSRLFNRFPRLVRDLARESGKEVELELKGTEVEVDRKLLESMSDPLLHLVRNAVDHGIESPDVRNELGKGEIGIVTLKAFHKAGQVHIEVVDDGKGLDPEVIVNKAQAKGLLTKDQAQSMGPKEALNLIFSPGFSTSDMVTDVSGRGVGMDVVKTNLERLNGRIDIESEPGLGTCVRMQLPLTLAIIPSQIVEVEEQQFAIPQVNLEELLRIPAHRIKERIEWVGSAEVLRLRERLLPLVRLSDVLGLERTYCPKDSNQPEPDRRLNIADRRSRKHPGSETESRESALDQDHCRQLRQRQLDDRRYRVSSGMNIAVVVSGFLRYGLLVDTFFDSEEIVVKPLGAALQNCQAYAGATIMGNGRVALILDVAGVAGIAELSSAEVSERTAIEAQRADLNQEMPDEFQEVLVFGWAEQEHFALPLKDVLRIEKIAAAEIQSIGKQRFLVYRGGNLPVFSLDEAASVGTFQSTDAQVLVIIFALADQEVGLLGRGPVDTASIPSGAEETQFKQPGIKGSVVVHGRTTLLVDVNDLMRRLEPDWFENTALEKGVLGLKTRILLVEDSAFFRRQIKTVIESHGYPVLEAEDGEQAWSLLQGGDQEISLIVTDLEMPNLDGFALTERIRGDERLAALPVIALSTLADDEDIQRGEKAGVDEYQIKLDKEHLMQSIERLMLRQREGTE